MNVHHARYLTYLSVCAAVLVTAGFYSRRTSVAETTPAPSATALGNKLFLAIPYQGKRAGEGRLELELVDPEDHVLARSEQAVAARVGGGTWRSEIVLQKPLPIDDLVWERLRYRFRYADERSNAIEDISSVSEILRQPVLHLLAQKSYLAGSQAAVRLVVTDRNNEPVGGTSNVRIDLVSHDHGTRPLFSGHLDKRGTTEAELRFPQGLTGNFELHIAAETAIGATAYSQPVQLEDTASILLTTEKPIYQPGQEIHVRALALDRANHHAAADKKLTFEVEDSRGNKVFKKATQTDAFGVASAEFDLADEVNLGTYHLRVLMGDPDSPASHAEIALNVEKYVLPKFKVSVVFSNKDGKPKRDYRPGDHVTGTVQTNYFFGKPVDHGPITIKITGADVMTFEAASSAGKTDGDGAYRFDLRLPDYFAGRGSNQGAARALVEATVTDAAGHKESRGEPITVSQAPLLLTAVPESGSLIPGIENQVFLLASYPDGAPAPAVLNVSAPGISNQKISTDASGIGVLRFKPGDGSQTLQVEANDRHGNHASAALELASRGGTDQVLLRTNRATYRTGEQIEADIFSTHAHSAAYVDVIKEGQTILTRDLDIVDGRAHLSIPVTAEMAGTLEMNAYIFGRDAQVIADHRLLFVQPAQELKIEAVADATQYKPGGDAHIHFCVTNEHGEGVSAALGIEVVDEAVFALAEKQPGFAKVFFYLEQEMMKPRYEIHGLSMDSVVEPISRNDSQQDRAARVLFSASEWLRSNNVAAEAGREIPRARYQEYRERYHAVFMQQVDRLAAQLGEQLTREPRSSPQDAMRIFDRLPKPRDSWGSELQMQATGETIRDARYFLVRSAGPDRRFDDSDDLIAYVQTRGGFATEFPDRVTVELRMEHDRGPFNGRAQVVGGVVDPSGAPIPGARVTMRPLPNGEARRVVTGPAGQFAFDAVTPGRYMVEFFDAGFMNASREVAVGIRDRAVLSATMEVATVTQAVVVDAVPSPPPADFAMFAATSRAVGSPMAIRQQGVASGVMGGVLGGIGATAATKQLQLKAQPPAAHEDHVRSYFPEALYINPEIITDGTGHAEISIPVADSITTWRMAMLASTKSGALGSGTSSIKVFQDFFADLDLPVTLTQGDRVSIPVAIYNYTGGKGEVSLNLQKDAWFDFVDDSHSKAVSVAAGNVGGSQFTIQANKIGKFKLTLAAKLAGNVARRDIVVREIEVVPNGQEQNIVSNGRLEHEVTERVNFPGDAIPDASKVFVRLYPGPLSQVIEGMDGILQMPFGCFEQTSSSTYPNVLALDYMKRTKKLTPEVHAKAEGFIASGYQRLLTFEVPGGGFSWFGQAPANKILTGYGLMEFADMARVHDVDPRLIARTQEWLAGQQQADGSWRPDTYFINEGATNRFNSDVLRITAYVAWSLVNSGYDGPTVDKAKRYIEEHQDANADAYTLAVLANFAVDYKRDKEFTRRALDDLLNAHKEKDAKVYWSSQETGVYSTGESAAIETTGLAVQALIKSGQSSEIARKALLFITSKKEASGNWGTTQATIMALRALLLASEKGGADTRGHVSVRLNGKIVQQLDITAANSDLLHQFVLPGMDASNEIQLQFQGTGGLAYQVAGRYFVPWQKENSREALSIDVSYDRTKLAENDIATATATISSRLDATAKMVMVDLGIPPGFDLQSEDLDTFAEKSGGSHGGHLEKYSLTATQAILYFDALAPHQALTIHYRLRAKYPIRAHTFQSRVYEYYDPQVSAIAKPGELEVTRN
jgi:uncharacterized protein YfaS (alpha-2-macroglobulin family)